MRAGYQNGSGALCSHQPCVQGKRVLMVGDRNDDMRGAADCGLDAAGALYGYGSREELETCGAKWIVDTVEDLEAFLERI